MKPALRGKNSRQFRVWLLSAVLTVVVLQVYLTISFQFSSCAPGQDYLDSAPSPSFASALIQTLGAFSSFDDAPSDFGGVKPRAFPVYGKVPCFPPDPDWWNPKTHRLPAHEGFFLLKEMKTAGSTAAGIHVRIARNEARRQFAQASSNSRFCKSRNDHSMASDLDYAHRDRQKSYLWTVIRDPTKRAISQFFHFEVSRKKVEPTDRNFRKWIQENHLLHRYYLKSLTVDADSFNNASTSTTPGGFNPVAVANKILLDYDFIGVSERMEETAVVLQLLLGLTTGDILYLNAKGSGGFDDGADGDKGCIYIVPSFVSPGMKAYFQSPAWNVLTATDAFLHQAANRSLDWTIARLGRRRFDKALMRFQYAMRQHVETKCLPNATFLCDASGELNRRHHDCLWVDSGCGSKCLDQISEDLNLYSRHGDE